MIDTVVLRIHRISEKYEHLVKYLNQINTDNYVKKIHHANSDEISKTSMLYGDTGNVRELTHRSSIHNSSSHYDIAFSISKERDFIELNFSLPKYVHSTNVLQFVDYHDQSLKHTFDKFQAEISRFFSVYFPLAPDWIDVEVNRIDLCFNQFFLNKGDALRYLDEQRNLNLQYARSDTNKFQQYGDTTVQYHTDNYSFKIYHKGTEFKKNDYLKLCKNNPKGFNLEHIRDTSDRILRYEMTCRKGLLNYIFKQKVKDDVNTMFNHNLGEIAKLKGSLRNNLMRKTGNKTKYGVVVKTDAAIEMFVHKSVVNKRFAFHLDSFWDYAMERPIDLLDNYELSFDFNLFQHLHNFFWDKVNRYQLGIKMGIVDIYDKIKRMQDDKDMTNKLFNKNDKIAQTGQLLLIATLSQYTDITDLKKVLPKATYYRYLKKLEDIGIPKHSPDIAVRPPELDFTTYFYEFGKYHATVN